MKADSYIIVGDLHLRTGSDARASRDFARLLDEASGPGPVPHLVLNGDVIELEVFEGSRGDGFDPRAAAARAIEILDSHPDFTRALARHLVRGGTVTWIHGNHDVETSLPEVRQAIRERLQADESSLKFGESLIDDEIHVEHGHAHDPDCLFWPDEMTALQKKRDSALPISTLVNKYLLSRIPRYEAFTDSQKTPIQVLSRVLLQYRLHALKMIALYPVAGLKIACQASLAARRKDAPPPEEEGKASPMHGAGEAIRRMYIDRYLSTAAVAALFLFALLGMPLAWLLIGLPFAAIVIKPAGRRKEYRDRHRRSCHRAASRIFQTGQKIVVMGHVHRAEEMRHRAGAYLNHGAFAAESLDTGGKPSRTYVKIQRKKGKAEGRLVRTVAG